MCTEKKAAKTIGSACKVEASHVGMLTQSRNVAPLAACNDKVVKVLIKLWRI